jgi:hypothetical protein
MLASAFKIKGLYFRGLMGVDILTQNIAQNPNLDLILAISVAAGLLVYALMYLVPRTRSILNWLVIVVSFAFFFRYIALFFTSVVTFYASTIFTLTQKDIFISIILLVFMTMTIIFYGVGMLALLFELWLRNELGLRRIIRKKELPEWMKHFDMGYIHHEKSHKEDEHGKKHEKIRDYVLEEMRRGHSFSTILLHLIKVGWSAKAIDDSLHELKGNEEFKKYLAKQENISTKAVASLGFDIQKKLNKGMHLKDIIKKVKNAGWSDAYLLDALLIIEVK